MSRTVTITRYGQMICVEPACLDVLGGLHTQRLYVVEDPQHGYQTRREREALYHCEGSPGNERIHGPIGLMDAVRCLLRGAGCEVHILAAEPRPAELPRPAVGLGYDQAVVDAVWRNFSSLIKYDGQHVEPLRLALQIAQAYADARVAVVAPSNAAVWETRKRLRRLGLEAAAVTGQYCPPTIPRVIVSTCYGGLGHLLVEVDKIDIVIVLDAVAAIGQREQLALSGAVKARLIGLVDVRQQLAPRERHWVTAIFGGAAATILRHGCQALSVAYTLLPISGGPRLANNLNPLAIKRQGIWRHPVRNRRIARLATGFIAQDPQQANQSREEAVQQSPRSNTRRVAVLVENIEHAMALASMLPDWPIVTGNSVNLVGLSSQNQELLAERAALGRRVHDRMIVTFAGMEHIRVAKLDVLIRADGGLGMPAALESATIPCIRTGHSLQLIDFDDRHHPVLRIWSRQRRQAYAERGWIESQKSGAAD